MSGNDTPDEGEGSESVRDRIESEADRAVEGFDQGLIDLLSWVLDTETRARIYVYLRQHPGSTSDEIAEGTGLYPSTVREALADLSEEGTLDRHKRESAGAGNNPYEYVAIPPSDLVTGIVGDVQQELNTLFNLDDHLCSTDAAEDGGADGTSDGESDDSGPVRITVERAEYDR